MRRFVITARLKRGSQQTVRDILREGPPFDPEPTSLDRHEVFLGPDELVFVFEGQHAEKEVQRLLEGLEVRRQGARIARCLDGEPRVAEEVFSWERLPETEGLSFTATPGPGDSEGGS